MTSAYHDPYAVLGASRTATQEEIRQAYFTQVRQHPPEREPEQFKRIRAAYDQLKTPDKRREADLLLLRDLPDGLNPPETQEPDLSVKAADVLALFKATTDLERRDFTGDFREVRL